MMLLSQAAAAIDAKFSGDDVMFTSVGADSRNIVQGQLFVALKGEHFDGHSYAEQAVEQGAAAVLVSKKMSESLPTLEVNDTLKALGLLASFWRQQFNMPVAAITGSNGKTTVKEMLACILTAATIDADAVLATKGNLNNHIGLPMTLLRLRQQHRYAAIEMGMNHAGEISYLTQLAKPTVATIINAGNAHIGELGSLEAIANAKGEIFEGLAADGIAVINADDVFAPIWKKLIGQRQTMTFGLKNQADVTAQFELQASSSKLAMQTPQGAIDILLPAPGIHNVMNALAAATTALAMHIPLVAITRGLQNYAGVKGRLQHLAGINGALVIDDCYNANPMSMKAAIDVLMAKPGEKLLVLGDMGELGEQAEAMHAEIGRYAKAAGVDQLLTLGTLSRGMTNAFGLSEQAVNTTQRAAHYQSPQALTADLVAKMTPTSVVLVKGSRFMAMEQIVEQILSKHNIKKDTNGEEN